MVSTAEEPKVRKWLPYLGMRECVLSGKWLQEAGNRKQNNRGLVSRRPGHRESRRCRKGCWVEKERADRKLEVGRWP